MTAVGTGLALHPFRGLRPAVGNDRLGRLLCPPYDVIDARQRAALLADDPDNAVAVILPEGDEDRYDAAARRLTAGVQRGLYAVDEQPALYVYEMTGSDGAATRGLLGAVELRDPADNVILPHENTMAGPVADRLALMTATEADVEPIYLVYDGGGAASDAVHAAVAGAPIAEAATPDGVRHRLWAITDPAAHAAIAADLRGRRALIADGHHRYATYRALQDRLDDTRGAGPWDRGLTLLVDSSRYGPQVHAIHRVLPGVPLRELVTRTADSATCSTADGPQQGLQQAAGVPGFAAVLSDGTQTVLLTDSAGTLAARARAATDLPALADLDVTVLHRALLDVWGVEDSEQHVGYAHSEAEAVAAAAQSGGTAVLLRPTPVAAVTAVAAAGGRMPRKSTLFTPKPASGLVLRRFADELPGS